MWTISVIFGLVMRFAVNAQDTTAPGTVARSSQTFPVGTPSNRTVVPKLDTRGKAIYWWRHGFGIGILGADVIAAGINEANGTPPEWQGAAGFGKRLGDTVGSSSIAAGIGFGLSTALHINPRFTGAQRALLGDTSGLQRSRALSIIQITESLLRRSPNWRAYTALE